MHYKGLIFIIGFDGVCVYDRPHDKYLTDAPGAVQALRNITDHGGKLVLSTTRDSSTLDQAVEWFKVNGFELYGININPDQRAWTDSPAPVGDVTIDVRALGIPTKFDIRRSTRPFIDWDKIRFLLCTVGKPGAAGVKE